MTDTAVYPVPDHFSDAQKARFREVLRERLAGSGLEGAFEVDDC